MRRVMGTVIAALALVVTSEPCSAMAVAIGSGRPLGEHGFERRLRLNPELRTLVALRGYPDWVEDVEVNSELPLEAHELRLYYLRLNREVAVSRAFILGRPNVSLRLFDRPIAPIDRARIEEAYLAKDPARRAELAADRATSAAEQAEHVADSVERLADQSERYSEAIERDFYKRLRK